MTLEHIGRPRRGQGTAFPWVPYGPRQNAQLHEMFNVISQELLVLLRRSCYFKCKKDLLAAVDDLPYSIAMGQLIFPTISCPTAELHLSVYGIPYVRLTILSCDSIGCFGGSTY